MTYFSISRLSTRDMSPSIASKGIPVLLLDSLERSLLQGALPQITLENQLMSYSPFYSPQSTRVPDQPYLDPRTVKINLMDTNDGLS
jgi:hypothetical protein